ncbi:hypothetical protein V1478_000505 [Vespula squamosa]|uniref:Uncharacterized protein n=1 Tax=Vespula squamosa TaxID=30214 RepID=A0ABD2C5Q0_VESSQ
MVQRTDWAAITAKRGTAKSGIIASTDICLAPPFHPHGFLIRSQTFEIIISSAVTEIGVTFIVIVSHRNRGCSGGNVTRTSIGIAFGLREARPYPPPTLVSPPPLSLPRSPSPATFFSRSSS